MARKQRAVVATFHAAVAIIACCVARNRSERHAIREENSGISFRAAGETAGEYS